MKKKDLPPDLPPEGGNYRNRDGGLSPEGGRYRDIDRELQIDLELEAEEQRDRGLADRDAAYAAKRALGNVTLIS